jgi:hypothetical protein
MKTVFLSVLLAIVAYAQPIPTLTTTPITISWTLRPPSENVTSYKISELVGTAYILKATVAGGIASWSTTVATGSTHVFAVQSVNARGTSLYSNQTIFPIAALPPGNVNIHQ